MKRIIFLVCVLLLIPSLVFAGGMKKDDSVYVSFSGMFSAAEDSTIESEVGEYKASGELELDVGWGGFYRNGQEIWQQLAGRSRILLQA